ncbi:hypothetical protein [Psychroserpens sp. MEBiC05023]
MKHLSYLLIVLCLCSCGRIPRYKGNNFKPISSVKQLEGIYNNYENDSLRYHQLSLSGKINWRKKHKDSSHYTSVQIKVLNNKRLKLDFIIDKKVTKSRIIKYRLRKNGFLKLRNQNFRISGIPLIFGEYEIAKYQLGLTHTDDLIIYGRNEEAGGILIVLVGGRSATVNKVFKRL